MKYLLTAIATLFFSACSSHYEPLPTVSKVNLQQYLGTWYEIARYEHFFEKGCSDVNATYSLNEDKTIKVLNSCFRDGEVNKAYGVAYATDESYAKLKVSFFRPFYGNYQILLLDEDYRYAVIGEPSREYFWILSRTKKLPQHNLDNILSQIPSLGYDASKLIWTKQN